MIKTKEDLNYYLKEDKKNYSLNYSFTEKILHFLSPSESDIIWKQIYNLRKLEYLLNNRNGIINKIKFIIQNIKYSCLEYRYMMLIPPNVFGPGLYIPHIGRIAIPATAKVGANCVLRPDTMFASNLGQTNKRVRIIEVGDNVEFSDGSKIFCKKIGDNVIVGANTVVYQNIPSNSTAYGNPCEIIPRDI